MAIDDSSSNLNTMIQVQTAIDNGVALAIIKDGERIRVQAKLDGLLARSDRTYTSNDSGLSLSVNQTLTENLEKSRIELFHQRKASMEKDKLIAEWMSKHEALKKLVQKYGKQSGLTDEEIKTELDNETIAAVKISPQS